jgi:hypothetical protein
MARKANEKKGKKNQPSNNSLKEGTSKEQRQRASSVESSIAKMVARTRPNTHPYTSRTARSRSRISDGPLRLNDIFDMDTNSRATPPPESATEDEGNTFMDNEETNSQLEEGSANSGEEELRTPKAPRVTTEPIPPSANPAPADGTPKTTTKAGKDKKTTNPILSQKPTSQDLPNNPSTTDGTEDQERNQIKDIEIALKEAAEAANIGGWALPQIPFNLETKDPPSKDGKKPRPSKEWVQWIPIKAKDLPRELLHHSGNNLDFMSEKTINECAKAAKGEPHNLGKSAIPLVLPGFKLLFHVVCFGVELPGRTAWMMHAIRSVLDVAKIDFSNALAIVPVSKPGFEWILVSFTKIAYEAFTDIRGLLDPRAQALVLIREWSMTPPSEQTLSFSGLLSYSDGQDKIDDAIKNLKEQVLNEKLKKCGISVTDVKLGRSPKKAPQLKLINVHLKFNEDAKTFVIPPSHWNRKTIRTAKGNRKVNVRFGPRCVTCSSESHTYAAKCPWLEYKVNNMLINANAPALTKPGESIAPKPPKRKHAESENADEQLPSLIDARPKKYRKVEKDTGKADENEMTEDEQVETMLVE